MRRLILLLVATAFALTSTAWAATPTDPRIAAAVAAWAKQPLYVDPDYVSIADGNEMLRVISAAKVPVYVAVVPTGEWFPEKDDTNLLAGRLAVANGKPGLYVVMDEYESHGVAHEIAAYAPDSTWAAKEEALSKELAAYLDEVKVDSRYPAERARTEPEPPYPEPSYPEDRFTVGKALGNGFGGGVFGLFGGGILAGIVLAVAAIVAHRREGNA